MEKNRTRTYRPDQIPSPDREALEGAGILEKVDGKVVEIKYPTRKDRRSKITEVWQSLTKQLRLF